EVRALAQRSSDAAREINELISASGTQVKRGVQLVDQAGAALAGIVESVSEISRNVGEIAVSSREQSAGLAEINEAVNQLDQVTQQNAAMFEETTAASHALTREAQTLNKTMGRFNTGHTDAFQAEIIESDAFATKEPAAPVQATSPGPVPATRSALAHNAEPSIDEDDGWDDF
ncbi:methyl-accepting chemotaxis protein, partial [Aliiroseovarius crassostreae]|uniref:methyl-accepting chemotaxis protein n=1 Tax=Aliiroseovarius crassostreae TaxID=154981 RepID=UPI003C7DD33D